MPRVELRAEIENGPEGVRVSFGGRGRSPNRIIPVRAVLDLDQFGHLTGIEILNLRHFAGESVLPIESGTSTGHRVRFAYDPEADAAYIALAQERSTAQV